MKRSREGRRVYAKADIGRGRRGKRSGKRRRREEGSEKRNEEKKGSKDLLKDEGRKGRKGRGDRDKVYRRERGRDGNE